MNSRNLHPAGSAFRSTMTRCGQRLAPLVLAAAICAPAPLHAANITVFAAASLAECLREIADDYEPRAGHTVVFNLAGSSFLARQIEEGAPADIFFSADEAKMDRLGGKGLIVEPTRKSRLSNALVVVVAATRGAAIATPHDLATDKVTRLAVAEPRTVPAGIYAKEYLQGKKLWAAVESKILPTANVRAALAAVEAGNAEAGIVYKTDAALSGKVKVAYEVPADDNPAISYSMAVLAGSRNSEVARDFHKFLDSKEAGRVFERHGFIVR